MNADRRPVGFALLAAALAWRAARDGWALASFPPLGDGVPVVVALLRVMSIASMAVAAEALWRLRPWCTKAVPWAFAAAIVYRYAAVTAETGRFASPDALPSVPLLVLGEVAVIWVRVRAGILFNAPPMPVATAP